MTVEMLVAGLVVLAGQRVFGRFERGTARLRLALRWALYLSGAVLLARRPGAPWSWLWILGLPALGIAIHVAWCRRHGIDALRAEPREKYYRLRGWDLTP